MQAYFGERWDAPAFDDAREVDTPIGRCCLMCDEPIAEGDSGTMMPVAHADGTATAEAVHIECHLRSMLGDVAHLEGRCTCYGGTDHDERPYRTQGREVMAWVIARKHNENAR